MKPEHKYFLLRETTRKGPFTEDEINEFGRLGKIRDSDTIIAEGMGEFTPSRYCKYVSVDYNEWPNYQSFNSEDGIRIRPEKLSVKLKKRRRLEYTVTLGSLVLFILWRVLKYLLQ